MAVLNLADIVNLDDTLKVYLVHVVRSNSKFLTI